jgi:hypothetical protein
LSTVVERQALVAHFGQDEVGRAVDDAGRPFDAVGGQAFAQRLDDRDAAGDRGLEGNHDALLLGGGEDLGAMHGQQRLVGGDHMLAVGDGLHHHFLGHAIAADQFDDDIDFRVIDHGEGVIGHLAGATRDLLGKLDVLVGNDARKCESAGRRAG